MTCENHCVNLLLFRKLVVLVVMGSIVNVFFSTIGKISIDSLVSCVDPIFPRAIKSSKLRRNNDDMMNLFLIELF